MREIIANYFRNIYTVKPLCNINNYNHIEVMKVFFNIIMDYSNS